MIPPPTTSEVYTCGVCLVVETRSAERSRRSATGTHFWRRRISSSQRLTPTAGGTQDPPCSWARRRHPNLAFAVPAIGITSGDRKADRGFAAPRIEHGNAEIISAFGQSIRDEETPVEDSIARKPLSDIHGNVDHGVVFR